MRSSAFTLAVLFVSGCAMISNVDTPISENVGIGKNKTLWERNLCGVRADQKTKANDIILADLYPQQSCLAFASALITWKRYRDAADDITTSETILNMGILGLAAGTIWAAIDDNSNNLIAGLGIGTAVLYSGSSILAPEQKREIYRTGAKAAACIMRRANGLLADPVVQYQQQLADIVTKHSKLKNKAADIITSNSELLARLAALNQKLTSLETTIVQDKIAIDEHSVQGTKAAMEISQSLIELDDKLRELLDQTLPNPATIFETVQGSTTNYLSRAVSLPGVGNLPQTVLPNVIPLSSQPGGEKSMPDDALDLNTVEKIINLHVEVNALKAEMEELHKKLQTALLTPYSFNFANCNNLGIETQLILTESEISLQAGTVAHVSIIGGQRPIRATMARRPSGLSLDRSFNDDGDTEFAIGWNGSGNQYGDYQIRFIDDHGAGNVLLLKLSPGLALAKTEFTQKNGDEFKLTINNGGTPPFYLFYQGDKTGFGLKRKQDNTFPDYTYGTAINNQPITLKLNQAGTSEETIQTFMLVDTTGKSATFTITIPKPDGS
jgi:regulator of replication initiation timing